MKKTIAFVLMIVLLVSVLVMTGCAKQTTVEFTVEGINDTSLVPFSTQNIVNYSRQEDINGIEPAKYAITFKCDGDYSFRLIDRNATVYPITLKLHNGNVEAVTPDGVTVNPTIK